MLFTRLKHTHVKKRSKNKKTPTFINVGAYLVQTFLSIELDIVLVFPLNLFFFDL